MNELDIRDTIKKYLDSLTDDDLLDLGTEINSHYDRECSWAWRMPIYDEMYMKAESALCGHTIQSILDVMEWAQGVKDYEYIDEDGDPANEKDFRERARDNIDDLVDCVYDSLDYMGVPDVYMAIDTDELLEEIKKTSEWQEEYGEEDE